MTLRPGWIAVALAAAALIGAVTPAQDAVKASAAPAGLKIGTVNLKQCFDSARYKRIKDAETEYRAFVMTLQEEIDQLKKEEKDIEQQVKLSEGMPKLQEEHLLKYQEVKFRLKMMSELNQQKAVGKYQSIQMDIYNGVRAVVDQYGKDNGFDLIIKIDEPKLEEDSPESVSRRISTRPILYANPTLDITDKIIDQLNAIYKKP